MGRRSGRFFSFSSSTVISRLPPPLSPIPHSLLFPQVVHFVFVPLIALTLCVWLSKLPLSHRLPFLPAFAALNPALAAVAAYAAYYTRLDPIAGLSWGAVVGVPTWLLATAWAHNRPLASAEAAVVHALSWAVQVVVGHGAIEGRRPALVDSFAQSVVLAPLFAWFEFLFFCGYRPGLKADVDAGVEAELRRVRGRRRRA